jgi:STE24 endopeptidase
VGLVLLGAVVGTAGNALVRRLSNPVGKYRLLYAGVLFPVTLLSYGLLALLGFSPALVGDVPVAPDALDAIVSDFVELLAAGLVWFAAYTPTVRGVREVRDIDLSTRAAMAKMARYVLGLSAVATVAIAPLRAAPSGASPLVLAVGLALVGVVFLYVSPWIVPFLRATSRPTGGTAERIATLRDRAGLGVRDVLVIDTDDEETASTLVRGPPGYRRLFVTSTFLEAFDDRTAAALLAVEAGRLRSCVFETRVGTVLVAGTALVAAVTGVGPRWPVLGVSFGALLVGFWLSRRGVRAADEYAAERVGATTVAEALDRYAERHAMEPSRRRVPNPLSVNVALGDRIDRLDRGANH